MEMDECGHKTGGVKRGGESLQRTSSISNNEDRGERDFVAAKRYTDILSWSKNSAQ